MSQSTPLDAATPGEAFQRIVVRYPDKTAIQTLDGSARYAWCELAGKVRRAAAAGKPLPGAKVRLANDGERLVRSGLNINFSGRNMSPVTVESAVMGENSLLGKVAAIGDRRKYVTALIKRRLIDRKYAEEIEQFYA